MDNNMTFLNACRNGQKSIVQIFLKKGGINVNKRDAEGNTPLYYACLKGFRDIVTILLDNDADVSIANNSSEIPLHATARSGNKEIIGKLIQYGANLDATDKEGRTPLICLLDNKRTDAALFLIEQGADTEITDNTGHKAIDYATAHGLREVVTCLSVKETTDGHGNTPLHQAVFNGQSETVRMLLPTSWQYAECAERCRRNATGYCLYEMQPYIAELTVDAGAEVNKALLNGNTPLHFAVWSENKFIGRKLIATMHKWMHRMKMGKHPLSLQPEKETTSSPHCLWNTGRT